MPDLHFCTIQDSFIFIYYVHKRWFLTHVFDFLIFIIFVSFGCCHKCGLYRFGVVSKSMCSVTCKLPNSAGMTLLLCSLFKPQDSWMDLSTDSNKLSDQLHCSQHLKISDYWLLDRLPDWGLLQSVCGWGGGGAHVHVWDVWVYMYAYICTFVCLHVSVCHVCTCSVCVCVCVCVWTFMRLTPPLR